MSEKIIDVGIIGGGPAGASAAIQLKRADINIAIFEQDKIGGLAKNANLIENYLGFPKGIRGREFVKLLQKQLDELKIKVIFEQVQQINWNESKELFSIKTNKRIVLAKIIVLATGTIPKKLGLNNEKMFEKSKLLFYEPSKIPEKFLFKSQIGIIGGGDAAFDYALNIYRKENQILIFTRDNNFKCLPLLEKRVKKIANIKINTNKTPIRLEYTNQKNVKITFQDNTEYEFKFIVIAIGREPNDYLIQNIPPKIISGGSFFMIGDLVNELNRQIAISSGDGLRCAMEIKKFLMKKK